MIMPFQLYATEYPKQLRSEIICILMDWLPRAIRNKALRYRRWQDSYGCLFGHLLLRLGLKRMNFSSDLSRLQYSTEHKPFLPAGPHFNISHSAGRVVCLLS